MKVKDDLNLITPQHNQLWETVLQSLRMSIVTGRLEPGTHLIETQIAQNLGVSRGPVREALVHLEQEGLAINNPYHGRVVVGLSGEDIQEIYDLRLLLESHALELGMGHLQSKDLDRLQRLVDQMVQALSESGRLEEFVVLDLDFHRGLIASAKSDRLLRMWETLTGVTHTFIAVNASVLANPIQQVAEGHQEILTAVAQRDIGPVREALRYHLATAEAILLKAIAESNG